MYTSYNHEITAFSRFLATYPKKLTSWIESVELMPCLGGFNCNKPLLKWASAIKKGVWNLVANAWRLLNS